jgi:hypothetical protein
LRIVSEELWHLAHRRLHGIREHLRQASGGRLGVRTRDIESRYLLSGFARCAVCGGGLTVMSRSHGRERAFFYGCLANHKRGHTICGNSLVRRIEQIDEAVLGTLGGDVLRPTVVESVLEGVFEAMRPTTVARDVEALRGELQETERALARLTEAIAIGGELAPLLEAMKTRQGRRDELAAAVSTRENLTVVRFDRKVLDATVRDRLKGWRALLTKHVDDGRQLLREVLVGPLRFTPEGRSYRFEGEAAIGRLLVGTVGLATLLASPTGTANSCTLVFTGIAA